MLNKWFQRQQTLKLEEALGGLSPAPKTYGMGINPDSQAVFVTSDGQVRAIQRYPNFDLANRAYHQKINQLDQALSSQEDTHYQTERDTLCYYGEGMASFWSMNEASDFGAREIVVTMFALSCEQDRETYRQLMQNYEQGQGRSTRHPKAPLTLVKS